MVPRMKSLLQYINEKLVINKNTKSGYKFYPKSGLELREIIQQKYKDNPKYLDCTDIDVRGVNDFVIDENITNRGIFLGIKPEEIDVSGWNVSHITNMHGLFGACTNLITIKGLETWDVSNVEDMSNMFNACYALESLDLSNWKTDSLQNLRIAFAFCKRLKYLNVTDWNVSNVNNIEAIFLGCKSLQKIDGIENWNMPPKRNYVMNYEEFKDVPKQYRKDVIPTWYK